MQESQPEGYLALPRQSLGSGGGAGVLVLHAWWGLTGVIRHVCDRLAGQGFVAYAPDLYHGQLASTIAEAETLSDQLEGKAAMADITRAVDLLWDRVQSRDNGLGVLGFSLGANFALRLSIDDPERVRAVALFYGTGDGDFSQAKADYLGHFAETDPYESAEYVDWLEHALKSAGRPATFYHYQGVGHWFFESDRPDAYNAAAARLAWDRTLAFLKQTL